MAENHAQIVDRSRSGETQTSSRYVRGMERLLLAVQELSLARSLEEVQHIVRTTARALTGCDGATFVLRDNGQCYYADEDAIEPLWKGSRFPMSACISGWTMLNRDTALIPDIYADARIPHEAYRPTFVKSLVMVPIRRLDPIGAIGNYWAHEHHAEPDEVRLLQALADSTSIAMENVGVYEELEQRVRQRTLELEQANHEISQLSLTDELTGLHNRRGFYLLAEQALREARRHGSRCLLLYVDVDGLKPVNDRHGHGAGDNLIVTVARALTSTLRDSDIVARIGGDEFCVLAIDPEVNGKALTARLRAALDRASAPGSLLYPVSASIGYATAPVKPDTSVDQLVLAADAAMYEDKRARRADRAA